MSEKAQGFEEYTPSRLEWLTVQLNSMIHYINTMPGERIEYLYVPEDDGKTILLRIRHHSDLPPEDLKDFENSGKKFAMEMAQTYKWDSWIEIQTHFDPIKKKK